MSQDAVVHSVIKGWTCEAGEIDYGIVTARGACGGWGNEKGAFLYMPASTNVPVLFGDVFLLRVLFGDVFLYEATLKIST